jgi:flagella basal body P-ring formation protein FlgA
MAPAGLRADEPVAGDCLPVRGGSITAGVLARAIPEFKTLEAEIEIFGAPRPGVRRLLSPEEIERAAARHGLSLARPGSLARPAGVCFAAPVAHIETGQIETALRRAIEASLDAQTAQRARIEILDWPRHPLPEGSLRAADGWLDSFAARTDGTGTARLLLDLGGGRTLPVRVQARIEIPALRWIAAGNLKAGELIGAGDVRRQETWVYPWRNRDPLGDPIVDAGALPGSTLRQHVPAGAVLRAGMFERPLQIARGDLVELRVLSGAARLRLTATAQRAGRAGDRIPLEIPGTGRRVLARVTGRGMASLEARSTSQTGASPIESVQ